MTFTNSLWQQWASASPDSRALITPSHTLNWRELDALVQRYSAYLNTQGLSKGDVLTIVGKNSSELVLAYLASLNLGVLVAMTMPQPSKKLEQKLETLYSDGKERFVAFTGEYGEALNVDAKLIQLPSLEDILGFAHYIHRNNLRVKRIILPPLCLHRVLLVTQRRWHTRLSNTLLRLQGC